MFSLYKIRYKLLFTFFTLVIASSFIGGISIYYSKQLSQYQKINNQIDQLRVLLLQARKFEKDFLIYDPVNSTFIQTGQSANLTGHKQALDSIRILLQYIAQNSHMSSMGIAASIMQIEEQEKQYQNYFYQLAEKTRQRGFKDTGLEGEMRKVAHDLENTSSINQTQLLTLRRHEKDFFIRKDVAYATKLHLTADLVLQSHSDPASVTALKKYVQIFDQIVALETEIGLKPDKGIKGSLKTSADTIEPQIASIQQGVYQQIENQTSASEGIIWTVVGMLLIGSVALGFYFSDSISRPIILLDQIAQSVVTGLKDQDKELEQIQSPDELGSLAKNFKQMLLTLKGSFQEVSAQNQKLVEASQEEKLRQWSAEGVAHFSNLLGQSYPTMEALCVEATSQIVKYLNANQAGLFLLTDSLSDQPYLELVASYAYNRRKYQHKQIQPGEGLVGQAFLERDMIYMTDVPKDYVTITSGLGEALPRCILIMPIQLNETIVGILELATFQPFQPHELDFLKKIGERMATTLSALSNTEKTRLLLKQSQLLTEELRAQEEEMRQNMEEMLSTQEYYQRMETSLKQKEEQLEKQILLLQNEKTEISVSEAYFKTAYQQKAKELDELVKEMADLKLELESQKFKALPFKKTQHQL
ncbi:GAF domain-containing protein [Xanthocytophaga flava]|uniref:GAF domain-containing protein n=1 Tax=Xanthocytophaga flava TaxID=3048013 RepID=UPI0028D8D720|nr:GAF domain-containing protein [Xanthocytophaga flavus]MDJ1466734.1 GAF domain-containing protein [Xanthocytophaga flavus]